MGFIINYLHPPIRRGVILCSIKRPLTLQTKRVLTTQGVSSSSLSPSSSKYELFFPSSTKLGDYYPQTFPGFEDNPHYDSDDLHDNEPVIIQKGQHFDVISLLSTHADDLVRIGSNNLVKANDLRDKYIILCCGFVPFLWIGSYLWSDLSLLSSELSQPHIRIKHHLEIVIVPKMRQKWDNDEGAFHHFFSVFPGCLSVPFTHKHRRDYICKSLNFEGKPRCIVVDPSQKVLRVDFEKTVKYGARGFPFTDQHLSYLDDEVLWTKACSPSILSLAGLLCCELNPSSFLLSKFDSEETISVEQLNKHHVLLYMFKGGNLLQEVQNMYRQCRDQGLDLEVVLVCLSQGMDPKAYQDYFECVLKKHQVSNWWVFPYSNSVSCRLKQLCYSYVESLFIVGPNNKFVEREAGEVLHNFGAHLGCQAYPFTMEALFRAFLQRLDTVTLESFLTYDYVYRDYECDDSKIMPVSELKGKNVLVYVDHSFVLWEDVVDWYNVIKEKDSDFELVYVPIVNPQSDSEYQKLASEVREVIFKSKTEWLICPFEDPQQSQFLKNHDAFLFSKDSYCGNKGLPIPSVLAFGKDGHLHSLQALNLLEEKELDAYPFLRESRNRNLCKEIFMELVYEFDFVDLYKRDLMKGFDFLEK